MRGWRTGALALLVSAGLIAALLADFPVRHLLYDARVAWSTVDDKANEIALARAGTGVEVLRALAGQPAPADAALTPLPLFLVQGALGVLPAVVASNLLTALAWLGLGVAGGALGRHLGGRIGAVAGAALLVLAPWSVHTMRASSLDYTLALWLPLTALAALRGRPLWTALAILGAGLTSPYLGLGAGLIALALGGRGLLLGGALLSPLVWAQARALRPETAPALGLHPGQWSSLPRLLEHLGLWGVGGALLVGLALTGRRWRLWALLGAVLTLLLAVLGPLGLPLDRLPWLWRARHLDSLAMVLAVALAALAADGLGRMTRRRLAWGLLGGATLGMLIAARVDTPTGAPVAAPPAVIQAAPLALAGPGAPAWRRLMAFHLGEWSDTRQLQVGGERQRAVERALDTGAPLPEWLGCAAVAWRGPPPQGGYLVRDAGDGWVIVRAGGCVGG